MSVYCQFEKLKLQSAYDVDLHTFVLGFYPEIHDASLRIVTRLAFDDIENSLNIRNGQIEEVKSDHEINDDLDNLSFTRSTWKNENE